MKHWYMPLDVGKWFADTRISSLNSSQRGIYVDLKCRMHDDDRCGLISKTPEQMAQLARCTTSELRDGLETLKSLFEVTERDGLITVVDLEMRKEWKIRKNKEMRNKRYRSKSGPSPPLETALKTPKKPPLYDYSCNCGSDSENGVVEGKVPNGNGTANGLSPLGQRIAGWFKRRETTKWSERELKELKKVEAFSTPEDDLKLLEARYQSNAPYTRQEILTLLNNWNGEIDKSRKVATKPAEAPKPGWKRQEEVNERIRSLTSDFNANRDEGARQSIREEITLLLAERKALSE